VRRLAIAGWDEVRLLFIGARDRGSLLSLLPMELIVQIVKMATAVPKCWATSRLRWFRAAAKASPDGTASLIVKTFDIDPYGDRANCPEHLGGYKLEYHLRGKSTAERFTVHWWNDEEIERKLVKTTGVSAHWSEAMRKAEAWRSLTISSLNSTINE
jgi:hypothetical protein